jgi:hypothetical protein
VKYTNFKNLVAARGLVWYYREGVDSFEFTTYDGPLTFTCIIYSDAAGVVGVDSDNTQAAVDDFNANHKAGAINIT